MLLNFLLQQILFANRAPALEFRIGLEPIEKLLNTYLASRFQWILKLKSRAKVIYVIEMSPKLVLAEL